MEVATFALGCFWSAEAQLGQMDGVKHTQVGYVKFNDRHEEEQEAVEIECVQIHYAPETCTYNQLLRMFWYAHAPTQPPSFRQYGSVIFYHNSSQKELAYQAVEQERRLVDHLYTHLAPCGEFHPAESFHQKKYLQEEAELLELCFGADGTNAGHSIMEFLHSTIAVKLNSFIYGVLDSEAVKLEFNLLDLEQEYADKIVSYLRMIEGS